MPKFTLAVPSDDEPENYNETIGGNDLAKAFSDRGGWLRGTFSINGQEMRNFEANSPENLIAQLNAKRAETGVYAELDDGRLKLSHSSPEPILIAKGAGYQKPNMPGQQPEPAAENTILDDLGLEETTEANDLRAQQMRGEGLVGQVGDGRVVQGGAIPPQRSTGGPQTAEEIEELNRAIMGNPRGITGNAVGGGAGGRAPNQPHETVVGTTTTGNRPQFEAPDSNAKRAEVQPGQETALPGQPVRAGSSNATSGSAPQPSGQQSGSPEKVEEEDHETDDQLNADPAYGERTNEELRQHARDNHINLEGASTKADMIRAIKKHDRKAAKEKAKQG